MPSPYPAAGGVSLLGWRLDDLAPDQTVIPHGYIKDFHIPAARAAILEQLKLLYAAGYRRLGIPILYYEGGDSIALDSSRGAIFGQDRQNLIDLLNAAVDSGFIEFICEMIPEWSAAWNNFANPVVMRNVQSIARVRQPVEYARNFIFTDSVWQIFLALPAATHLDPLAEGIPAPGQDLLLDYCQRLVGDLDDQYHDPMISISIIPTLDRIPQIRKVYGLKLPAFWNVHMYLPSNTENWPGYKAAMNAAGLGGRGYVFGEKYLNQGLPDDESDLFFMIGWPVGPDTPEGLSQDRLVI